MNQTGLEKQVRLVRPDFESHLAGERSAVGSASATSSAKEAEGKCRTKHERDMQQHPLHFPPHPERTHVGSDSTDLFDNRAAEAKKRPMGLAPHVAIWSAVLFAAIYVWCFVATSQGDDLIQIVLLVVSAVFLFVSGFAVLVWRDRRRAEEARNAPSRPTATGNPPVVRPATNAFETVVGFAYLLGIVVVLTTFFPQIRELGKHVLGMAPSLTVEDVWSIESFALIESSGWEVTCKIHNHGPARKVRVTAELSTPRHFVTQHQSIEMAAHEKQMVRLWCQAPHLVAEGLQPKTVVSAQPE